jgi:hypothetical protein
MPRDEEHGKHKIMDLLRNFSIWHGYDFLKWHGYDFPNEATMISRPANMTGENRTNHRAQY